MVVDEVRVTAGGMTGGGGVGSGGGDCYGEISVELSTKDGVADSHFHHEAVCVCHPRPEVHSDASTLAGAARHFLWRCPSIG